MPFIFFKIYIWQLSYDDFHLELSAMNILLYYFQHTPQFRNIKNLFNVWGVGNVGKDSNDEKLLHRDGEPWAIK